MNSPEEMSEALEDRISDCKAAFESEDAPQLRSALAGLQQMIVEISREASQLGGAKNQPGNDPVVKLTKHIKSQVLPQVRTWQNTLSVWEARSEAKTLKSRDNENTGAVA